MASDFVKALTNTFVICLFAYQNMRELKFVLDANESIKTYANTTGSQKVLSFIILD